MECASAPPVRRYRSSGRDDQARRTRQRVIAAARAAFLESGYAGTTMRAVASRAGVSVPTVEASFGTKARLLKAAIDIAIVGDDEPVPVLDRSWTTAALAAPCAQDFLAAVAAVITRAQVRSAGLVLAAFEGAATEPDLAVLETELIAQRVETARWVVDGVIRTASLRDGCSRPEAIDTVWLLMDPVVFDRLTRRRNWSLGRYEAWFAGSVARLLLAHPAERAAVPTRRRFR